MGFTTQQAIEIIFTSLTEEEQNLLGISTARKTITFKDQLVAQYGRQYPRYDEVTHETKVAMIIQTNKFNLLKLKGYDQLIKDLSNPEAFYKASVQASDSEKLTGITSDNLSSAKSLSSSHSKNVGGTGTFASEESDVLERQALEAEAIQDKLINFKQITERQDFRTWSSTQKDNGQTEYRLQTQPVTAPLVADEKSEERLTLSVTDKDGQLDEDGAPVYNVEQSDGSTTSVAITDTSNKNAKAISTGKQTKQTTLSYKRAAAEQERMSTQILNIRNTFLNQFSCLFTRQRLCR